MTEDIATMQAEPETIPEATADTLRAFVEALPAYLDNARIVGKWVWAIFPAKPSDEVRAKLKELGFRWNPKRSFAGTEESSVWQHSCGFRTRAARGYDPRDKYGERRIRADKDN